MARALISLGQEIAMLNFIYNPLFWDKKIKIAILALATFIALC